MKSAEVNGVFVAAHELKSPLCLIRQLALSLDFNAQSLEQLEATRGKLVGVSERAMKQINDLLKVTRLEDGLFEMEPVAVCGVCDDVTRELRELYKTNHRSLNVCYVNKSKLAVANRDLLHSVIYNFCTNALHYSDAYTAATLTVREKTGKIRVDIRDFGPALPTPIWRELQKGFVEQPTSIAMRPGSSGLGLYIASVFSKYMNAEVGAIRHRDGTSFYVELPISHQSSIFDFEGQAA